MIEISRLMGVLGALSRAGGQGSKIAMAEVTLAGGEPGLIVFAAGRGAALAKEALEAASPKEFQTLPISNHAEN